MAPPTIVCLTPVRNEAWILERFLKCASLWADVILLADQGSVDESLAIARAFPKVRVIANPCPDYDECARQQLLIGKAREWVPGRRLLLALDADEMLTANYATSAEWPRMLGAPPGTVFRFRWVNLCPDLKRAWLSPRTFAWGLMDDGSMHTGKTIHSVRVPVPSHAAEVACSEIMALHYQYTDPGRMRSKHRWYQCFERVRDPGVSAVKVFDQYHHSLRVRPGDLVPVNAEWLRAYEQAGIDMVTLNSPADGVYWWDPLVLEMMRRHGPAFFAKEHLWDDWPRVAERLGADPSFQADPRTPFQKRLHRFLMSPASLENRLWARSLKRLLRQIGY